MAIGSGEAAPSVSASPSSLDGPNAFAIDLNGKLLGWGSDTYGQLGLGRVLVVTTPVAAGAGFRDVSVGEGHVVGIRNDNSLWAWGWNTYGQLGDGSTLSQSRPAKIGAGFRSAAAGSAMTVAVKTDNTLWMWGQGIFGTGASVNVSYVPMQVGTGYAAAVVGHGHVLALKTDGSLYAWGTNADGQVGAPTTDVCNPGPSSYSCALTPKLLGTGYVAISAGESSSYAIKTDGTLWAWGKNNWGQLGDGTQVPRDAPVLVGPGFKAVSGGRGHAGGIKSDGSLWAWGGNYYGQIGDDTLDTRLSPVKVGDGYARIAFGSDSSFAVTSGGVLRAWGDNADANLGNGGTAELHVPTQVATGIAVAAMGPANGAHIRNDGTLLVGGRNNYGQLGNGTLVSRTAPTLVGTGYATVATIGGTTLAVKTDGTMWAWGKNTSARYGNGFGDSSPIPVQVRAGTTYKAIAAGAQHALSLMVDGTVHGWGTGAAAGNGGAFTQFPVQVGTGFSAISAGFDHSVGIKSADGSVWAWGNNDSGQLGDGTKTARTVPTQVPGITEAVAISAGAYHTMVLKSDGTLWAFGDNSAGQLGAAAASTCNSGANNTGNPNFPCSLVPVQVSGTFTSVSAGVQHTNAIKSDGSNWAWGTNYWGYLGIGGSTPNPTAPTQVATGFVNVVAAGYTSFGIKADGTVWSWGQNAFGVLGDGTYLTRDRNVVVIAQDGSGSIDGNDWYLDLDPTKAAKAIPALNTPKAIAVANLNGANLDGIVKYKSADYGKKVRNYVVAAVPPAFFNLVKTAPGTPRAEQLQPKAGGLVLAQLTPAGWTTLSGQLIAFSSGTASAAGGAASILEGVPLASITGARFCIGYGENADLLLTDQSMRELLVVTNAFATEEGVPCVLSGLYLDGPAASKAGSAATFNAVVVGIGPTGSVQFYDGPSAMAGSVSLAPAGAAAARASITTSSLSIGEHSIGASYSGDGPNLAVSLAEMVAVRHEVTAVPSGTITELTGPASSGFGAEVRFTATVTGNNPTGTVRLHDNGVPIGTAQPLVDATATLTAAGLATGTHSLTAVYTSGDGNNTASTSSALSHVVVAAVFVHVQLSSNPNPATAGQTVTLAATVTGANPTGNVTFREGALVLGTKPLVAGAATLDVANLEPGIHEIIVEYPGDANNQAASSGTLIQQVSGALTRPPTSIALASSLNPAALAQPVTFTATVSPAPSGNAGTVTFLNDGIAIVGCTAAVPVSGVATCLTSTLQTGTRSIAAAYSGNSFLAPSSSSSLAQVITPVNQLLSPTPATVDFGGQSMNTTSPQRTITLKNATASPVTVTAVTPPAGFGVASNGCTAAVPPSGTCQVAVTFTPGVEGATEGSLAVAYAGGGPTVVILKGIGERSLTTHYYRSILRRDPDSGGKAYWNAEATRVAALGSSVNEVWFAMAQAFYFSPEYTALNRDNAGYVTDLYNTFFNRPPDSGGLAYWIGQLGSGMPREVALASFMFSAEFVSFTTAIFGSPTARAEVNAVVDFYRGLLARTPDDGGFSHWVGQFRAAQCQNAAAVTNQVEAISSAFALSGEYAARARNNSQYVGDLYNAFLRRGGDLPGVQHWIGQLNSSAQTREQLRAAFKNSAEFQARVNAIIGQGCLN